MCGPIVNEELEHRHVKDKMSVADKLTRAQAQASGVCIIDRKLNLFHPHHTVVVYLPLSQDQSISLRGCVSQPGDGVCAKYQHLRHSQ